MISYAVYQFLYRMKIIFAQLNVKTFINDEESWPGIGLQDFVIALFVPGDRTLQKEVCNEHISLLNTALWLPSQGHRQDLSCHCR